MSVLLALCGSVLQDYYVVPLHSGDWFCFAVTFLFSFPSSQGKVFSARVAFLQMRFFLLLDNSKMLNTDMYSQLQQAAPQGPGTVQCVHLHLVFCSLHARSCGFCAIHGMHSHVVQILFMTCLHVVQVLFMTRVAMWYFALFTPCTFMWNLALSEGMWYRFCS